MVATNPRLSPRFFEALRPPWLPERTIWRLVLATYAILGLVFCLQGRFLLGPLFIGVALWVSPRCRDWLRSRRGTGRQREDDTYSAP